MGLTTTTSGYFQGYTLEDLEKLRSLESEVGKSFYGVIIGRALYEEAFSLEEATRLLGDLSC